MISELSTHRSACAEGIPKNDIAKQREVAVRLTDSAGMVVVAREEERHVFQAALIGRKGHTEHFQIARSPNVRDTIDGYVRDRDDRSVENTLLDHPFRELGVEEAFVIVSGELMHGADEFQDSSNLHSGLHSFEPSRPAALDYRVPKSPNRPCGRQAVEAQSPPSRPCRRLPGNRCILRSPQHFHFHGVNLPRDRTASIPPLTRGEAA